MASRLKWVTRPPGTLKRLHSQSGYFEILYVVFGWLFA